jgi:hypothetical protein
MLAKGFFFGLNLFICLQLKKLSKMTKGLGVENR